jgi:hypothetical protein
MKNGGSLAHSVDNVVQMRAIASSMPSEAHAEVFAAGEVIDLALVAVNDQKTNYVCPQGRRRPTLLPHAQAA